MIDIADHVFSTQGMINHVSRSDLTEFIIGTEEGLCYRLKKENPEKEFYPAKRAVCPNMKKITMKKVLKSLETLKPEVILPEDTMERAKLPLEKMVGIGRGD